MILHLLKKANELGWQLVCSLDVSAKYIEQENGPDYPLDVHSWFLCKNPSVNLPSAFSNSLEVFIRVDHDSTNERLASLICYT